MTAPELEFRQLQQKGRSEIERRLHIWKSLHEKGHVEVRLGRVESHPGHTGGPRDGIRVVRLVHMPEEGEADVFHGEVSCRLTGSMS